MCIFTRLILHRTVFSKKLTTLASYLDRFWVHFVDTKRFILIEAFYTDMPTSTVLLRPRDYTTGHGFLLNLHNALQIKKHLGPHHLARSIALVRFFLWPLAFSAVITYGTCTLMMLRLSYTLFYGSAFTSEAIEDTCLVVRKFYLQKFQVLIAVKAEDDLTGTLTNPLRRWQHGTLGSTEKSKEEWVLYQFEFSRLSTTA